jgi:hypothetical protein
VSSSAIGFLTLGLGVGGAVGMALLAAAHVRRTDRPGVRITITPNAIPPRSARPSAALALSMRRAPVPGSPEDDAWSDAVLVTPSPTSPPAEVAGGRTRVPTAPLTFPTRTVGIPVVADVSARLPASSLPSPAGSATVASAATVWPGAVALAVADPEGAPAAALPARTLLDVGERPVGLTVRPRLPVGVPRPAIGLEAIGFRIEASAPHRKAAGSGLATGAPSTGVDPCADDRATAAERCAAADTTRDAVRLAADALRGAQRQQGALEARVEEAGATGDPRRVTEEKVRLHEAFTAAHDRAGGVDEAEAAARVWLTSVSELNDQARDAAHRVQAGTAELRELAVEIDRLVREAEAARIAAERAEGECRAAREALAQCEEREQAARRVPPPEGQDPLAEHWPGGAEPAFDHHPGDPVDLERMPAVIRILRGDGSALESVVATLSGDDPATRPEWQVRIARLIDAITARAIEDGYLDLPEDDSFWGPFSDLERREIVGALSSLGFRYDGLQGFEDGRVPSARDLSLAVGYAGLDRMRIRTWPGPAELTALYSRAVVASDLWLARQTDDLALGRVVDALGTRAADLAEVWDAWGRVRPALLADG